MRGMPTIALAWVGLSISSIGCTFLLEPSDFVGGQLDAGKGIIVEPQDSGALPALDGGTGTEASTDGGCQGVGAKYCDDFDRGTVATFWDAIDPNISVDRATSLSPPLSLLVTLAPRGGQQNVSIGKSLPAARHVRVTGAINIEANGGAEWMSFLMIDVQPPPNGYENYKVAMSTDAADYRLQRVAFSRSGSGSLDRSDALPTVPANWSRIVLDVVFDEGKATASVDGQEVIRTDLPKIAPATTRVAFGMPYVDTAKGQWRVRFDDATIDWQ